MKNFSLTYAGILVAVLGPVLVQYGFSEACSGEISNVAVAAVGGLIAAYGRYRVGGITALGKRA